MSFINEFISPEDVARYDLEEIDKKFVVGGTDARDWTIDRERDIYLRNVARGREDWRSETEWTFYWRGHELTLRLDYVGGTGERGGPAWDHWRLVWLNGSYGLPAPLKPQVKEILKDLEDALLAYKDFGVYSASTDFSVTLDIDPECVL